MTTVMMIILMLGCFGRMRCVLVLALLWAVFLPALRSFLRNRFSLSSFAGLQDVHRGMHRCSPAKVHFPGGLFFGGVCDKCLTTAPSKVTYAHSGGLYGSSGARKQPFSAQSHGFSSSKPKTIVIASFCYDKGQGLTPFIVRAPPWKGLHEQEVDPRRVGPEAWLPLAVSIGGHLHPRDPCMNLSFPHTSAQDVPWWSHHLRNLFRQCNGPGGSQDV